MRFLSLSTVALNHERARSPCRVRLRVVAGAVAALAATGVSAQGVTWGRTIGTMCVEGVPSATVQRTASRNDNGIQIDTFNVRYARGTHGGNPIARVFSEAPKAAVPLDPCSRLRGHVLFEGVIDRLEITGAQETAAQAANATFRLDAKSLNLWMIRSKSDLAPLYGGDLELDADSAIKPSARTWITNDELILAQTGQVTKGSVDIESWGRKLRGAKLVLPGAAEPTSLDMTSSNANVTIRVPFDGNETQLLKGSFVATDQPMAAARLEVPGASFQKFAGKAAKVELSANEQKVAVTIAGLGYDAAAARFDSGKSLTALEQASGLIKAMSALAPRSGKRLDMLTPALDAADASAVNCSFDYAGANVTKSDACKAATTSTPTAGRRLQFGAPVSITMLSAPAFKSGGVVQLASFADTSSDTLEGSFADTAAFIGALELVQQTVHLTTPQTAGTRVEFPFSFSVAPAKGGWKMKLPDGKVALEGSLAQLRAKGKVSTDITVPQNWAIDIAHGDLAFEAKVAATYEPILYGAKPQFGAVGLKLATKTALQVTGKGGTGTLLAGADVLILADPKMNFGTGDATLTLEGPTRFDGAVTIAYDLGSGIAQIDEGRLRLDNAQLVTQPDKVGDFGGVRIHNGKFALGSLAADVKEGKGKFEASAIQVSAAKVEAQPRASDAGPGNQMVWSGRPVDGFRIASIEGSIVQEGAAKELKVDKTILRNAQVAITDARLGQGAALQFTGERLSANFTEISDSALVGSLGLYNARVKSNTPSKGDKTDLNIDVASLEVALAGGKPSEPVGTAVLNGRSLSIAADSKVEIRESCDGQPDFGGVPVHAKVLTGPISLKLTVDAGGLRGGGSALVTFADLSSRDKYKCQARVVNIPIIEEQRVEYNYPCPTWSKPFRTCSGWTVLVPRLAVDFDRVVEVRSLKAKGFFTVMSLKLEGADKVTACGKLGAVAPLADISYYITPKTGIDIADSFFKEVIDQTARPWASAIVTGLGALYGSIMPITPEGLCS